MEIPNIKNREKRSNSDVSLVKKEGLEEDKKNLSTGNLSLKPTKQTHYLKHDSFTYTPPSLLERWAETGEKTNEIIEFEKKKTKKNNEEPDIELVKYLEELDLDIKKEETKEDSKNELKSNENEEDIDNLEFSFDDVFDFIVETPKKELKKKVKVSQKESSDKKSSDNENDLNFEDMF